jgi:hypothetical protein
MPFQVSHVGLGERRTAPDVWFRFYAADFSTWGSGMSINYDWGAAETDDNAGRPPPPRTKDFPQLEWKLLTRFAWLPYDEEASPPFRPVEIVPLPSQPPDRGAFSLAFRADDAAGKGLRVEPIAAVVYVDCSEFGGSCGRDDAPRVSLYLDPDLDMPIGLLSQLHFGTDNGMDELLVPWECGSPPFAGSFRGSERQFDLMACVAWGASPDRTVIRTAVRVHNGDTLVLAADGKRWDIRPMDRTGLPTYDVAVTLQNRCMDMKWSVSTDHIMDHLLAARDGVIGSAYTMWLPDTTKRVKVYSDDTAFKLHTASVGREGVCIDVAPEAAVAYRHGTQSIVDAAFSGEGRATLGEALSFLACMHRITFADGGAVVPGTGDDNVSGDSNSGSESLPSLPRPIQQRIVRELLLAYSASS